MNSLNISESGSGLIPLVSNFEAYRNFVMSIPLLSEAEEQECLNQWETFGNRDAAKKLVMSHLRLVLKVVKQYEGYGLNREDLVQEGNVGLMKAIKNFKRNLGVRLMAYAIVWIRSEVQEYILENWKLVKIGGTKGLKKLFFNYRSIMKDLQNLERADQLENAKKAIEALGVREDEWNLAKQWFEGGEISLNVDQSDGGHWVLDLKASENLEEKWMLEDQDLKISKYLEELKKSLTSQELMVIEARFKEEPEKLKTLALKMGCSIERVRQIEEKALIKMKTMLEKKGLKKEALILDV